MNLKEWYGIKSGSTKDGAVAFTAVAAKDEDADLEKGHHIGAYKAKSHRLVIQGILTVISFIINLYLFMTWIR